MARQRYAREEREKRAAAASASNGSKWTGKTTIPVAPKLSCYKNVKSPLERRKRAAAERRAKEVNIDFLLYD